MLLEYYVDASEIQWSERQKTQTGDARKISVARAARARIFREREPRVKSFYALRAKNEYFIVLQILKVNQSISKLVLFFASMCNLFTKECASLREPSSTNRGCFFYP